VKNAYSVNGHTCDEDADGDAPSPVPAGKAVLGTAGKNDTAKPQ
jgi:hypothetical protein